MSDGMAPAQWLLLLLQFPKDSGSLRVRIWRRLQNIGAVAVRSSVYALPNNEQSREDFAWLLKEIQQNGADGSILDARLVDGLDDASLRAMFSTARQADYAALADEVASAVAGLQAGDGDKTAGRDAAHQVLRRARARLAEIEAIDFFAAEGHDPVEDDIRQLSERLQDEQDSATDTQRGEKRESLRDLSGRVWVTRRGVRVDRIASAWLIRRFIDPDATFRFVTGDGYKPKARELRFDMFEAEFTHEGDRCTFEVLARLARPDDRALACVGEIVHDIDLKDGKFNRPETAGIANLLTGIVAGTDDDRVRLERGGDLFENLYRFFAGQAE